ncbi:hypothetical protein GCM10007216_39010 [Thalassobacillus devorans]|uniref:Uncharacterized protein n=1 Tax=Thalassobacillus devorans TaxID=279813 RepID=A0ABQ1PVA8_9BACI|nr:hypothetical protein GCM10007216_39010 [Thalassobacillus devorans]
MRLPREKEQGKIPQGAARGSLPGPPQESESFPNAPIPQTMSRNQVFDFSALLWNNSLMEKQKSLTESPA